MARVAYIDPNACGGAPTCPPKRVCPAKAILHDRIERLSVIDENKCTGCGICIRYCPHGAIVMKEV